MCVSLSLSLCVLDCSNVMSKHGTCLCWEKKENQLKIGSLWRWNDYVCKNNIECTHFTNRSASDNNNRETKTRDTQPKGRIYLNENERHWFNFYMCPIFFDVIYACWNPSRFIVYWPAYRNIGPQTLNFIWGTVKKISDEIFRLNYFKTEMISFSV